MIALDELQRALEVATQVARAAGALLRDGARQARPMAVDHKGEVDLVTEYDRRSEELVTEALQRALPHHAVVGEEGTRSGDSRPGQPVWYVDPLDGTTNYAHRLPWYAVSLGLELDHRPLLGVVHAPEMGWDFWAIRGQGAHLGQERLHVSTVAKLDSALLATGFPYDRRTSADNNLPQLGRAIRRCQGIRRMGVASLDCALVAWGRLDGYWEHKLKPWDISAGALLVLEAGGEVTTLAGAPFRSQQGSILASNGLLHQELQQVLAGAEAGD